MTNPFYIEPANPLQALMIGEQSYDRAQKRGQENELKAGRLEAMQALQSGGDIRNPLAKLIGIGDTKGAEAIAQFATQQATQQHQGATLAETSRFHTGTLKQQADELALRRQQEERAANEPKVVPAGTELVIPRGPNAGQKVYGDAGSQKLDEDTLDAMARQYRAGDTSVLTNLGRGAQGSENVVALRKRIAQQNREANVSGEEQAIRNAEYFGTKAGQRTLGARSANIELAATEFKQVLPIVAEASKAVDRTRFPDLNKVIQAFEQKTGDPNIVKFGAGINTLINLYARAISPSGTPTVSDKDHAREILSKAWSQGQFDAATGMMVQEIDAANASPEKVRDEMRKRFLGGAQAGGASTASAPPAAGGPRGNMPAPPPGFKIVE